MKPIEIELPPELVEIKKQIYNFLKTVFGGNNDTIEIKISNLTNRIQKPKEGLYFSPFPSVRTLNKISEQSGKSVLSNVVKTFYLSDDRRLPNQANPDYKRNKDFYYTDHIDQIIFIFSLLKQDLNFNKNKITQILMSKIEKSEVAFLNEILEAYFQEKTFSFISMSMSFTERILRKIFKTIHQRDINTLNKAQESQVKVKLTDVLNDDGVKKAINEDFIEYSKWLLNSDFEGLNVRNKVSHGFVEYDFYTNGLADLILHYIINIIYLDKLLKEQPLLT